MEPPNMEDKHIRNVENTHLFFSSHFRIAATRAFVRSVALEHLDGCA